MENNQFKINMAVEKDLEKQRIADLRKKYDNREISLKDVSLEDMDEMIESYKEETAKINEDILRRKANIARMLRELKQKNTTKN